MDKDEMPMKTIFVVMFGNHLLLSEFCAPTSLSSCHDSSFFIAVS